MKNARKSACLTFPSPSAASQAIPEVEKRPMVTKKNTWDLLNTCLSDNFKQGSTEDYLGGKLKEKRPYISQGRATPRKALSYPDLPHAMSLISAHPLLITPSAHDKGRLKQTQTSKQNKSRSCFLFFYFIFIFFCFRSQNKNNRGQLAGFSFSAFAVFIFIVFR